MSGAIKIKSEAEGKRQVKALLRNQTRTKVDFETGIPGAGKQMEKMDKRIEALEQEIAKLSGQYDNLWAWKMQQELKGE